MYALTYWKEMGRVIKKKAMWSSARDWLNTRAKTPAEIDATGEAYALMEALGWDVLVMAGVMETTPDAMTLLLSSRWLDDEVIAMLLTQLSQRASLRPSNLPVILIAPVNFVECIKSAALLKHGYGDKATTSLKHMKARILEQRAKRLYLVANINNVHWVALELDFEAGAIRYGDSLQVAKNAELPRKLIVALQQWTKAEFGRVFTDKGNLLPHGIQEDATSCGVCSINTIEHCVFGGPLFTPRTRNLLRLQYFNSLMRAQLNWLARPQEPNQAFLEAVPTDVDDSTNGPRNNTGTIGKEREQVADAKMALSFLLSSDDPGSAGQESCMSAHTDFDVLGVSSAISPESTQASDMSEMPTSPTPSFYMPSSPTTSSMNCSSPSIHSPCPSPPPYDHLSPSLRHSLSPSPRHSSPEPRQATPPSSPHATVPIPSSAPPPAKHGAHTLMAFWERQIQAPSRDIKRAHLEVAASDDEPPNDAEHVHHHEKPQTAVVGTSATSIASRKLVTAMREGSLQINPKKYAAYKDKIYALDPLAEISSGKQWTVWHSVCEKWYSVKEPYHTTRFKDHVGMCIKTAQAEANLQSTAGILATSGNKRRILDLGKRNRKMVEWMVPIETRAERSNAKTEATSKPEPDISIVAPVVPCPGISPAIDPRVTLYFKRPIAGGGGGRRVGDIAHELYKLPYKELTHGQKAKVNRAQVADHKWRNDRALLTVFSTTCLRRIPRVEGLDPHSHGLCPPCASLLRLRSFRKALNVKAPANENYKYANKQYLDETLDPKHSIFAQYAAGIVDGKFAGCEVLNDLITGMVELQHRNARGVGCQNFKYGQALMSFANTCAIMSPQLYRILATQFQLPSLRDLKRKQARVPKFPLSICERSFEIAKEYLARLGYSGPVAIACDDSKLLPSFRTYWDNSQQMHFLVGGIGEPMAVANVEELQDVLKNNKAGAKATKLRVWCMLPSVPGASTLVLAVKPIPNSLTAPVLTQWSDDILSGLVQHNIWPISYACDGTETERCVQRALIKRSPTILTYEIRHPFHSSPPIIIEIATRGGRPIVMVQDNKHGLKTGRNNNFTGAKTMVIGNSIVSFAYVRDIAFEHDSPLFNRDIEKLDRQDDNAACRLFSATVLEYLTKKHPEYVGQTIYLFIIGELVDAYQNRRITHSTRICMVLRARFFVEVWRAWLKLAGYKEKLHFISREFADIMHFLIDGLIGLIIVHRDHMDGRCIPLCPWLHASEMVEHIFAELRKLVSDFTCLDVLYAIPRIHVLIREVLKLSRNGTTSSSDPKATASGYAHTYFDTRDMDLRTLAIFPSDTEIEDIAKEAWAEMESLMDLAGICAADVMSDSTSKLSSTGRTVLPSVASWLNRDGVAPAMDVAESDSEDDYDADGDENASGGEESELAALERLIEQESRAGLRNRKDDERMTSLTCAAVAVAVDKDLISQGMLDPTDEELQKNATEDGQRLAEALQDAFQGLQLPNVNIPEEAVHAFDHSIDRLNFVDFSSLVATRRSHETWRAKHGVRVRGKNSANVQPDSTPSATGSGPVPRPESAKQAIAREMQSFLREQQDRGVSSGVGREIRWTGSVSAAAPVNGNSLNAALAAGQRAQTVSARRLKKFTEFFVPSPLDLSHAMVGTPSSSQLHSCPLQRGSYGLVIVDSQLMVCKVIALFSRGGGKTGVHSWYASLDNIGLLSYASVQIYEPSAGQPGKFRAIHRRSSTLQCYTFAHLPSDAFLRLLPGVQTLSQDQKILHLNRSSGIIYNTYAGDTQNINSAVTSLMKARRKGVKVGAQSDEE
ncbi:hypothetical protein EUX98_g9272 [Antrodiella citrinella]|uniref:Ubiquitin-like protease family profile domain-containing protein n=1 Tax=Antrodiella citrinella TaxID=2447956 RepID=A0A4S4LVP1_9APHY|nr:hypothetical protein EUX98_g9272 [Antrodiella citrinella]